MCALMVLLYTRYLDICPIEKNLQLRQMVLTLASQWRLALRCVGPRGTQLAS